MTPVFLGTSLAYAVLCLLPAAMKIIGTGKMREAARHFGIAWPRYRRIGLLELAAAAAVLMGLQWPLAGLVGAAGMVVLLIGAVAVHRRAGDAIREYAAAIVFLVASVGYFAVWAATSSTH